MYKAMHAYIRYLFIGISLYEVLFYSVCSVLFGTVQFGLE